MTDSSNCTSNEVIVQTLKEWNFTINIVLLLVLAVLQFGYIRVSKLIYTVKMVIIWILWPLTAALGVYNAYVNYGSNWLFFAFSIVLAVVSLIFLLMYFINSLRLYRRTFSMWSWSPNTTFILCVDSKDLSHCLPIHNIPSVVVLSCVKGDLVVDGVRIKQHFTRDGLPSKVAVAAPSKTVVYVRDQANFGLGGDGSTFWVNYVPRTAGNYNARTVSKNSNDRDDIYHML
ncbi:membrane protein [Shrew coronavirus]|uniref:Membrane protein n=1 Tax=Common shrew coronavirus Tibet-2014 TaxID=2849711 RepID=A0A2H4MX33_9ALPC|nr:membrane protein [Shrew coronavirus]ATP66786.1 membrane protein [Common shrew coronavirus Tibet-2014]